MYFRDTMGNLTPIDISTILDATEQITIYSTPVHNVVVLGEIKEIVDLSMILSDESGTIRQKLNIILILFDCLVSTTTH